MRVECPHCHAVFEVPQTLLGNARRLRCANCGESWDLEIPQAEHIVEEEAPLFSEMLSDEQSEKVPDNGSGSLKRQSVGVESLAAREIDRRQSVLHSRTINAASAPSLASAQNMIGSTTAWLAAWGISLMTVGTGAFAVLHWKAGEVCRLLPAVGHVLSH